PAHVELENDAPDFMAARRLIEALFDADSTSRDNSDVITLYRETFYRPARIFYEGNPETATPPDYLGARAELEAMFGADTSSKDYSDSLNLYRGTFYNLAEPLLNRDSEPISLSDYETARAIFAEMFAA